MRKIISLCFINKNFMVQAGVKAAVSLIICAMLLFSACVSLYSPPTTRTNSTASDEPVRPPPLGPVLQIDSQGHRGLIWDIAVSNDGDIITASDDKTIRVWDSRTGQEKRKILGQIWDNRGGISAIALSADNRYLAAAGVLSGHSNRWGAIRIYDYPSGELIRVLEGHGDTVYSLAFSDDDRYLVSGSSDKTVKIWDSRNWQLAGTMSYHTDAVSDVLMLSRADSGYDIYSASADNRLAHHRFDGQELTYEGHYDAGQKLYSLASNGERVAAAGYDNDIFIFTRSLQKLHTISKVKPRGLSYSPDGGKLLAGQSASPSTVTIYNENYTETAKFTAHTNVVIATAFLNNNTAMSAGGNNMDIYLWNANTGHQTLHIAGVGHSVVSVGIQGDRIAWGNTRTKGYGESAFDRVIDLSNFGIQNYADSAEFTRMETVNGAFSLSHRAGGNYGYNNAELVVTRSGQVQAVITKGPPDGYRHLVYGWYGDYIVSGGFHGGLIIYDRQGNERARLIGHTNEIWGLALEGDRLISGSDDQTIRVWNLAELNLNSRNVQELTPMLNIFVSDDDEYVVWSNSGYFASSVNGARYVGYHINKGADTEAQFVSSDRYFDTLYRPDIIEYIWETGSEEQAIAFAGEARKVETVDIAASLPPIVRLEGSSYRETTADKATLFYTVESDAPVLETSILLNGRKLRGLARAEDGRQRLELELDEGENLITLFARNRHALSNEAQLTIYRQSSASQTTADIYKPALYLISIGVSAYDHADIPDLDYAHKDAGDIADMFSRQKGILYRDVMVRSLTNANANRDNILDALDWLEQESTQRDIAMIYIAGHGLNDDKGNYYYLNIDADPNNLRRTALKWTEIEDTLASLSSKIVLLADTCHSGNIAGGSSNSRNVTAAVSSILNSGIGSVTMTAATGSGFSYEDPAWENGAFTEALLKGLGNQQADYDRDGSITIKEIDLYVTQHVKALTNGKQKPTTIIPDSVPDYALWVKN